MGCTNSQPPTTPTKAAAEEAPKPNETKKDVDMNEEINPTEPFPGEEDAATGTPKNSKQLSSIPSIHRLIVRIGSSQRISNEKLNLSFRSGDQSNHSSLEPSTPTINKNPNLNEAFLNYARCNDVVNMWIATFDLGSKDWSDKINGALVSADCMAFFKKFPRGENAGELLMKPIKGEEEPGERGVKLEWLSACFNRMKSVTKKNKIPTRAFVEVFIRPFLLQNGSDEFDCLYHFIPLQFRSKKVDYYISHAWDGWLRHVFYMPSLDSQASAFVDFLCLSQIDENPREDFVDKIGEIVRRVKKTVVILPGDGPSSAFAMLSAFRSWCVFEISQTPIEGLIARVGLKSDLGDLKFHEQTFQLIETYDALSDSVHSYYDIDRKEIAKRLKEAREGTNEKMKRFLREAFADRYQSVLIGTPNTPMVSKFDSVSELYLNSHT